MNKALCFLSVLFTSLTQAQSNTPLSFTILQLNDIYEIAPLRGSDEGGLARVATIRKDLLQKDPNTITVLAGDFVSPSLIGTLNYHNPQTDKDQKIAGKHMVDVLDKMGLDYVTFGNHEFDIKLADLQARIDESTFTWVNSNVYRVAPDGTHYPFAKVENGRANMILPYSIRTFTYPDNRTLKVGIIGATIAFNKADSIGYEDEYKAFIAAYDNIRSQCDVIVGLTHISKDMDSTLATKCPGLTLICGGHEHTNMRIPSAGLTVCKADANDKTVYIHTVSFNPSTKRSTVSSRLQAVNKSIATDPETNTRVQYWLTIADSAMIKMGYNPNQRLMYAATPLDGREESIRNGKTNYTRLIADALYWADTTIDCALYNSGSLRVDDQLSGEVTQYDVLRSLPYGGTMVTMRLSGATLDSVLNIGTITNKDMGGYLQTRNIASLGPKGGWLIKGNILQKQNVYNVMMPEFLAQGKEKNLEFLRRFDYSVYTSFRQHSIRNDIRDILIAYMLTL